MLVIPIRVFADCCARATSGHAAVPPMSVMKSRRLMGAYPKAKDHGRSIAGLGVGQWRASQQKGRPMTGLGSSEPAAHVPCSRDPNWRDLLMENLQSLIAQFLGVAFAILGQLND